MAQGISQRLSLGLNGHYEDMNLLGHDVKDWADRLPFGSYGFQVRRSTSLNCPSPATTTITYNTVMQDRENWMMSQTSPFSRFIVPSGGSGVYLLCHGHFFSSGAGQVNITVNGASVGNDVVASRQIVTCCWLSDNDILAVSVLNTSGVLGVLGTENIGFANSPLSPIFSAVRIALL